MKNINIYKQRIKENNQIELIQKIRHHLGDQTNRETYIRHFILLLHQKQRSLRKTKNTKRPTKKSNEVEKNKIKSIKNKLFKSRNERDILPTAAKHFKLRHEVDTIQPDPPEA